MDNLVGPRLFHITRLLLLGTLLILSTLIYLAENFTGAEAETAVNTPLAPPTKTAVSPEKEPLNLAHFLQKSRVETVPTIPITQTNPAYGLNRISNSEQEAVPESQYQNGLATGATWDRWPLYWNRIEFPAPAEFHWEYQDTAVIGVINHGLKLNAILLGTPDFYRTDSNGAQIKRPTPELPSYSPLALAEPQTGVPLGLYEPVFADGDEPGPGKTINPNNVWARFVATAVNRYKPGGDLAQEENWPDGIGVTHWEMWNEPDLIHFWDGSAEEYARLLKVGYLAAKHADPDAQIIFGGLADIYSHPADIPFLTAVLTLFDSDPLAQTNNYFHNIIAVHNYSYAYRSWKAVYISQARLDARQLDNEIWLNETGVPVWDDYPGPVCDPNSAYRATMTEQADFVIQTAVYARYVDVDNLFFFSLYDECGNSPSGFNPPYFPPEQCASNPPPPNYAGDAFGLFRNRNRPDAFCATHHPQPDTARPALAAFQLLTRYFVDVEPTWRSRPGGSTPYNGVQEWFAFYKPSTGERVLALWSLVGEAQTAVLPTTHSQQTGMLITPDGVSQTITATNQVFTLTLPAATNNNTPTGTAYNPIGGRPFLLIEPDDLPPETTITAPLAAAVNVMVSWTGNDLGSNIANFDLTVSENGGPALPWLVETTAVSATYASLTEGSTYIFTVYGRDQAGNVSDGISATVFASILDNHVYLPTVQKR